MISGRALQIILFMLADAARILGHPREMVEIGFGWRIGT
jgi:hypothetical protein